MKRIYSEPTIDKIDFDYREQVVAASGGITGPGGGVTRIVPCLN